MHETAALRKGFWNPTRKLNVTMHFSEKTEFKLGEKMPLNKLYFRTFLELGLVNYL